jgi:hypothetical protein
MDLKVASLAATIVLAAAGCGAGTRQLESLSVTPATATSAGVPVQFTATGHWTESPESVTPQQATWGACTTSGAPTSDVSVTSGGSATCTKGAKGTFDVFAWDPQYGHAGPECTAITACGTGCGRVSATVKLTCP